MRTRKKMFLVGLVVVVLTLAVVVTAFAELKNISGNASVDDWANSPSVTATWNLSAQNTGTSIATAYLYIVRKLATQTDWQERFIVTMPVDPSTTLSKTGKRTIATDANDGDVLRIAYYATTDATLEVDDSPLKDLDVQDSITVDLVKPTGYVALPPLVSGKPACNEFERFGVAADIKGKANSGIKVFAFTLGGVDQVWTTPGGSTRVFFKSNFRLPGYATTLTFGGRAEDIAGNERKATSTWSLSTGGIGSCASFTDVAGSPYETYIRYLGSAGIFAGYTDGSFKPNGGINRAELATILVKATRPTSPLPTKPPKAACNFSDVHAGDWFAGWVWKACDLGFVSGYTDGTFRPANPVLRAEAVTMLYNAVRKNITGGFFNGSVLLEATDDDLLGNPSYMDVPAWAYYAEPIGKLYNAGIVDETAGSSFRPNDPATRGEVAKWLYRALGDYEQLP